MTTLIKFLIVVVMFGVIPVTALIYFGASNLTGKMSILSTGILLYLSLGFSYSWLSLRPANFKDWLKH